MTGMRTCCERCGNEILSAAGVCPVCSWPIGESTAGSFAEGSPAAPIKDRRKRKVLAVILGCIAFLTILCVVLFLIFGSGKLAPPAQYGPQTTPVILFQSGDHVDIYVNGEKRAEAPGYLPDTGSWAPGYSSNIGYSRLVFSTFEGENDVGKCSLYDLDGNLVIDDVAPEDRVSINVIAGNSIAYARGSELYLIRGGESTLVTDRFSEGSEICAFSPDGTILAYTRADGEQTTGCWFDTSEHVLGEGIIPFGVSDEAHYLYCYDQNKDLSYVLSGSRKTQLKGLSLIDLPQDSQKIWFCNDLTQIIYLDGSGEAHVCLQAGRVKRLDDPVSSFLGIPGVFPARIFPGAVYSTIVNVSSFAGTFYMSGSNVCRIGSDLQSQMVAEGITSSRAFLSEDTGTLVYQRGSAIFSLDTSGADAAETRVAEGEETALFVVSADGSGIFYTENRTLLCRRKNEDPVVVSSDFVVYDEPGYRGYILFKGNTLYYLENGMLYRSDGGAGERVGEFTDMKSLYGYRYINVSGRQSYHSFDGEVFIKNDSRRTFLADWETRTLSGGNI